jgi:hypothetical protein
LQVAAVAAVQLQTLLVAVALVDFVRQSQTLAVVAH